MSRQTFRVMAPIPSLDLEPGDLLLLEPGADCPVVVCKAVDPSPAAIAAARLGGALTLLPPVEGPAPALRLVDGPAGGYAPRTPFNARVRERMAALGLNQEQLAARVGVRQSTVSWWTRGGIPRTPRLALLADALEVSVDWLVEGPASGPSLQLVR